MYKYIKGYNRSRIEPIAEEREKIKIVPSTFSYPLFYYFIQGLDKDLKAPIRTG